MIDLKIQPTQVTLVCSGCGTQWPIDEVQPFVPQLRLVAFGHVCAPIERVIDVRHARRERVQGV